MAVVLLNENSVSTNHKRIQTPTYISKIWHGDPLHLIDIKKMNDFNPFLRGLSPKT